MGDLAGKAGRHPEQRADPQGGGGSHGNIAATLHPQSLKPKQDRDEAKYAQNRGFRYTGRVANVWPQTPLRA